MFGVGTGKGDLNSPESGSMLPSTCGRASDDEFWKRRKKKINIKVIEN